MARLKKNFQHGTLSAQATSGATSLSSAGFASLPAVSAPDVLPIVLDPDAVAGTPEIVWVTAHTASATTVTVTRGQETADGGSTARTHANGTAWRHAATAADYEFTSREVGYAETTAAFTTTSATYVDVTGLSVTATVDGNPIEIEVYLPDVSNSTAGQTCALQLALDGTAVRTQLAEKSAAADEIHQHVIRHRHVPAAGSHTWKAQVARSFGGSGTITLNASASNTAYILVRYV